jgi:hypothetical protein
MGRHGDVCTTHEGMREPCKHVPANLHIRLREWAFDATAEPLFAVAISTESTPSNARERFGPSL